MLEEILAINTNHWVIDFVSNNWILLGMALGAMKALAHSTPWSWDNKITTLMWEAFQHARGKRKNGHTNGGGA